MSAAKNPQQTKPNTIGKPRLLRTVLLGVTALTGFGASAALAQPVLFGGKLEQARLGADTDGGRYGYRYEDRRFSRDALGRFHDRVEWAFSRGALDRREADRLHFRANALDDLARAMSRRDGLDFYEREDLDVRFAELRDQFRRMVWERDYRGPYRDEWRNRRDTEERARSDDDRTDMASRDGFGARDQRAAPDLKTTEDEWEPFELGKATPAPEVSIPPPQPYRSSQQPVPPTTRKPSPSQKSASKAPVDDQPFKDGRDFH